MSQCFRKLLHVPFCTFYSKPSYSGSLCLFLSCFWYLDLFGSIPHGPWSQTFHFYLTLNVVPPKILDCTFFIPWAGVSNLCVQPRTPDPDISPRARATESFCFLQWALQGIFWVPLVHAHFLLILLPLALICYSGNPKIKSSSLALQNIHTIFLIFGNREF